MNLIDQSLEQVDFALRRRFFWINCPSNPDAFLAAAETIWATTNANRTWEQVSPDFHQLAGAATALNNEIRASPLLGSQYEVGHTYLLDAIQFLKDELASRPTQRLPYLWKRGNALPPVRQIWRLSLKPLLEQYLSGLDGPERETELARLETTFLQEPERVE